MKRPDTREHDAYSGSLRGDIDELTPWQVNDARVALSDLKVGQLLRPAELADEVAADDRLGTVLETLALGILRLPFRCDESEGDQRRAAMVAREFEKLWTYACPEPVLAEAIRWLALLGIAVLEVVWTFTASTWRPRLKVWDLRWIYYDHSRRTYVAQTTKGPVDVEPNKGKWIVLELAEGERAWLRGALRSLAMWWLLKTWCSRDWGRKEEIQGAGIRKAIVPINAEDGDKRKFFNSIANLGSETTIECAVDENGHGFDVEQLVDESNTYQGFEKLIARADKAFAVRVLGQDMQIEAPATYVPQRAYGKIQQDRIEAYTELIETALHDGLAVPWALYNYGDAELAPWACWDAEPPPDKKAQADTMLVVANAVNALNSAGFDADEKELSERFGFTVRKRRAPATALPPQVPNPPPAPAQEQQAP